MNEIAVMSQREIEMLVEKIVHVTIKKFSQGTKQFEHLSEAEAATYLMVSPATLCTWRCRSKGPRYMKVGKKVMYKRDDLDDYVATKQKCTQVQISN